jgi:hypothetical protein
MVRCPDAQIPNIPILEDSRGGGMASDIAGDTLECHYGLASAWLHRWRTEYDQRGDDLEDFHD